MQRASLATLDPGLNTPSSLCIYLGRPVAMSHMVVAGLTV